TIKATAIQQNKKPLSPSNPEPRKVHRESERFRRRRKKPVPFRLPPPFRAAAAAG
ncbi:hypothetical protein IscW_ISCW008002, partial [Ixodes scapularis]